MAQDKICPICNKSFKVNPSSYLKRHYCSRKCMGKAYQTWDGEELRHLYWEKGMNTAEIGRLFGVGACLIAQAMRIRGISFRPASDRLKGEKHPAWKGGRKLTNRGYVLIYKPMHHRALHSGFVLEHIVIWEENHKSQLPKGWLIHHLNGLKDDNRIENLVAMRKGEHIHIAEHFKKRILALEKENNKLKMALQNRQFMLSEDIQKIVEG